MRRYLTPEEQNRLLTAAKRMADPLAQRDYHWMNVLLHSGMRIQEFSRLTVSQVRRALQIGWLINPKSICKGRRKANEYCVTASLRKHLEALVQISDDMASTYAMPADADQPLVWGHDQTGAGCHLSVRSYQDRMKHWARAAGLDERISPHWLRHTRGMNIMRTSRGDRPLKVVQMALNHSSLKSTGIYLQLSREEFEREMHAADGGRVSKQLARRMALGGAAA